MAVKPGDMPGDMSVRPIGATRRACPESLMSAENRFQQQLALTYQKDGSWGVMLFERKLF